MDRLSFGRHGHRAAQAWSLIAAIAVCFPAGAVAQAGHLEVVRAAKPFEVVLTRGVPSVVQLRLRNTGPGPIEVDRMQCGFGGASRDEPLDTPRPTVAYASGVSLPPNQIMNVGLVFPAYPAVKEYEGDLYLLPGGPAAEPVLVAAFPIRVLELQGATLPRRISGWISALLAAIVIAAPFMVRGRDRRNFFQSPGGNYSISRFQVWLWTAVILFSYAFLFFTVGPNIVIPDTALALMGISVGSITAATAIAKSPEVLESVRLPGQSWLSSMLSERGEPSPMRLQMFAWTIAVVLFFSWRVVTTGTLWDVPVSILAIMGISHGGYLVDKGAQRGK